MDLAIFNRPHIMFDLETLDSTPGGVIVSIGACKFTFEEGISDKFYINVDAISGKKAGLTISKDTLDWWSKQPKEVRDAWQKNPDPIDISEALAQFNDWIGQNSKALVWSQGGFDKAFLQVAYKKLKSDQPWKYYNEMDCRTIFTLLGVDLRKVRESQPDSGYHNALADAVFQTNFLISLFS